MALDLLLVIVIPLGVAGVAIGTVSSQFVSCILVLWCLHRSEGSYQLRFSKLTIKWVYLKRIFQVGIPAGIQSTVINFSNAMLQSSVNSFGSTAMAGYTAANNVLSFLYVSVNAVTQACMSFTSQNYSVGKQKRMDRVLADCMILSAGVSAVLGVGAYVFGSQVLGIYTSDAEVIKCGMEILSITTVPYFLCGIMDLIPGALRGMGHSAGADGAVGDRYGRDEDRVDLRILSASQVAVLPVYLLSGLLDRDDTHAGSVLLVCPEKVYPSVRNRKRVKNGKGDVVKIAFYYVPFSFSGKSTIYRVRAASPGLQARSPASSRIR